MNSVARHEIQYIECGEADQVIAITTDFELLEQISN